MINYTLPDFTVGLGRNLFFITLAEQRPEYFADDVRIDSVYGCFPACIANGGRTFVRERYTPGQIDETFAYLADHGVKARLTLTNMLLTEEHLRDEYLNTILEIARGYDVEVILYADAMDRFVKEQFGFPRVLSTTRDIDDIDELNEATKRYDYVVLSYNRNKDRAFIDRIEEPGKIEVMVNEFCSYRCPHRHAHYLHNSADQLDGALRPFRDCAVSENEFVKHEPGHPVLFTADEVRDLASTSGIEYFKIVGRGIPAATVLEAYVHYLIKPAYRDTVRRRYALAAQRSA